MTTMNIMKKTFSNDIKTLHINDYLSNLQEYFIPGIHYMSLGCAFFYKIKSEFSSGTEQQYPPFLSSYKSNNPNIHITLILIDPVLELQPQCLTLLNKYEWTNTNYKNVYDCKEYNMTIYCFNESVSWENESKCINIYSHLINYNDHIIQNKSLLFVHDFTGRNIHELANMMDIELRNNIKYIMYDITLRRNLGCYFDLNDPCNMPIIHNLEIINPFMIINIKKEIKEQKNSILLKQLMSVVNLHVTTWNDLYFPLYRQLTSLLIEDNQDTKLIPIEIPKCKSLLELNELFNKYNTTKNKLILNQCIQLSKKIMINELRNVCNMLTIEDVNTFINKCSNELSTTNTYLWWKNINNYLVSNLPIIKANSVDANVTHDNVSNDETLLS